jgi:hypothetical protein
MSERRDDSKIDELPDELSFTPVLRRLWSYRRILLLALIASLVAYLGVVVVLYARMPRERIASIAFQLTFEGAERDRYPNNTKFSASEIVSTPVLAEVFRLNELQRYAKFQDFKETMFVLQSNPDLELLSYEYQAKLADTRLTPVDRARLEEEFRKKREALKSGFFSLNFRQGDRVRNIPDALLNKILMDTLSTWAHQAADRKGAVRYNVPVLTKGVFAKDALDAEDQVVAVDSLRNMTDRMLVTVAQIEELPGAAAARIGENQVGLADVRANLEDLQRFRIEPLLSLVRSTISPAEAARAVAYLADRLQTVRIQRDEVRQRITALQDALRGYQQRGAPAPTEPGGDSGRGSAVTPQVSESFIDRLVQLSTQSNDVEYRQQLTDRIIKDGVLVADLTRQVDYYEALQKTFASGRGQPPPVAAGEVARRTTQASGEVGRLMDQVQSIYKQIAEQNLNPDSVLYSMTTPFVVRTTSSLSQRTVLLYLLVTLVAAAVLVPLICLAHDYFRHWISPRGSTRMDTPLSGGTGRATGV